MDISRRQWMLNAMGCAAASGAPRKPKKILILGGTGYLGPATVRHALARGHALTLFNRGRTRPGLFPDIETLLGDRDPDKGAGLTHLMKRSWDAVIDNSGYFPRQVSASARLLAGNVGQYIYISSISAYAGTAVEGQDENAPLARMADPTVEKITEQTFGPLKALCEEAVAAALPKQTAIVRPGYIVGPDDPSGRFTYWPVRASRGGEMVAPGAPSDPVQFIDVRDLGEWLVHLIEQGTMGAFNATGPSKRLAWSNVLSACSAAVPVKPQLTWIPGDWIAKNANELFPIWAPYLGDTRGFHRFSNTRALRAGLRFRPCQTTVRDTLAWYKGQAPGDRTKLAGPDAAKEAELLAQWKRS